MTRVSTSKETSAKPIGRQSWALAGLVAATAASLVLSINAWAVSPAPGGVGASAPAFDASAPRGEGHHMGGRESRGEFNRGHQPGHGFMEVDARFIEKLLDDVKATDAQRAQIRQIGDKARADLRALQAQLPAPKPGDVASPMSVLTQAKVDATEIEKRRQQMLSFHDNASKLQVRALVDIANVLTPEQRQALSERMHATAAHMPPRGADQRQPLAR